MQSTQNSFSITNSKNDSKKENSERVLKLGIIIPVFNGDHNVLEKLIHLIFNTCQNYSFSILIVDDGSKAPLQIPNHLNQKVDVLRHEINKGKGAALKTGFNYFAEVVPVDVILTMDADLQHPPEKIPAFIQKYQSGLGHIIVGYRNRSPKIMPLHRMVSNSLTSLIISLLTGQLIRDSQCGYRLIDQKILNNLELRENRFHLESELFLRAAEKRISIGFVPIATIYSNQKSSIRNVRDTLNFIALIFRYLWGKLTHHV